jgi:hypothetical protein
MDPTPIIPPATPLSIDSVFSLFTLTDLPVMISIGVLTFFLVAWEKCPNWVALFGPTVLGGVWGLWTAVDTQLKFGPHIMKGFLINGAAASVAGILIHQALEKLGWNAVIMGHTHKEDHPRDPSVK